MAGRHRSNSIGPSTEFRDYRPYVPGDDIRQVDWHVYARTDRFYLRTHNQETTTVCHIFLDSSASMGFGSSPTKLDYASSFAAALAFLVVRGKDTVSLQCFDEDVKTFLPPGSTTAHLQQILQALDNNQPDGKTSTATALQRAFPLLRRKGAVIVLSDFYDDPGAIFAALNPYLHKGFEVHLYHVLTPEELELPERGLVTFADMETGQRVIAHTRTLRHDYQQAMQQHIENIRELARRRGVTYTLACTDNHHFKLFDQLVQ